ncbi:Premnaspirodiene oxygenase [Sesamum angolense]|uniref:Premnaspirodiene oxygenase n=1 Tax=Sesamum angolense TaxID=2727404 RepID=A0AAE1W4U8_9LAMI|nr:Premnaspirodiene oxygenase [Sesamum angolense]
MGPILHLQLGEISAVVILAPRVAKELLTAHDLAFSSRPRLPSLGTITYNYQNIALAPYGDYWKQMRKICFSELLSSKNVRSFSTLRDEVAVNLVESIRLHPSSIPIDLTQLGASAGGFDVADLFPSLKLLEDVAGLKTKYLTLHHKMDQVLNVIIDQHMEKLRFGQPGEEDPVDVLLKFKQKGNH